MKGSLAAPHSARRRAREVTSAVASPRHPRSARAREVPDEEEAALLQCVMLAPEQASMQPACLGRCFSSRSSGFAMLFKSGTLPHEVRDSTVANELVASLRRSLDALQRAS